MGRPRRNPDEEKSCHFPKLRNSQYETGEFSFRFWGFLIDKTQLLTEELPVLRAKIGLSQSELSNIIGVPRQTYSAIETKKRKMTWGTFISLVLFFEHNEKIRPLLISVGAFPESLEQMLNANKRDG